MLPAALLWCRPLRSSCRRLLSAAATARAQHLPSGSHAGGQARLRAQTQAKAGMAAPAEPVSMVGVAVVRGVEDPDAPDGFVVVKEGQASILFPKAGDVFYNPVQEFNRDLSICAIKAFEAQYRRGYHEQNAARRARFEKEQQRRAEADRTEWEDRPPQDLRILEALSATGLRSVRYWKEIPGLDTIVANDLLDTAVEAIRRNVEFNGICPDSQVLPNVGDASMVMYQHREPRERYHVVDIDPYGSAAPFLDGAVQCVNNGGLLCVTCTDAAVLCGNHSDACYGKYSAIPVRAKYCHEMGIRILLHSIAAHAARYGRYIVPVLSCSIDFYFRVFVRVHNSKEETKRLPSKLAHVHQCAQCAAFYLQPLGRELKTTKGGTKFKPAHVVDRSKCAECGSNLIMGGPFWAGPLHDKDLVNEMLQDVEKDPEQYGTHTRMLGHLSVAAEELDTPFFYSLPGLSASMQVTSPKLLSVRSALLNLGYKVSGSHALADAVKTDAPPTVLYDIMREWAKSMPVKGKVKEAATARLHAKAMTHEVSFAHHPQANPKSRQRGLVRFQNNPTANWGPKARPSKKRKDVTAAQKNAEARKRARGQRACLSLLKTGACKYGEACDYSHPMADELKAKDEGAAAD